ncbi:hypothetical protein Poli38472_010151 [Pythium oligandrum]|uniref:Arrestin C-terminal-like domain-containing protein n=1 Tax=Pythium oligandrum TaxID=41045 RepID=A0A8K1FGD8_PYTOL|nr:hypothetical protein Poli38472_010151 [Pythium oligandrum]|eukprot:TMW58592.1 hypothetical protein Poli38472_010151 [Pythium oligandrum]
MGHFSQKLKIGGQGSLDVSLDKTVFKPGDIVSGHAHLVVDQPITTRGLTVTISGWERLVWEKTDNHGNNPFKETLDILNDKVVLLDALDSPDGKMSLEACTRELPFSFKLPAEIPESFEYKCQRVRGMEGVRAHIEYSVTATLLVDGSLNADLKCVIPIVVEPSAPKNLRSQPVTVSNHDTVKYCGLFKQGGIYTEVTINSNVLETNSIIIAKVAVKNWSKRELESLRLCLVEDICIDRHRKRFNRKKSNSRDVCSRVYDKRTLESMKSDSNAAYELHLPVALNDAFQSGPLLPSMKSHFIVSLGYRVVLESKFNRGRRTKVDMPVTVARSTLAATGTTMV